eukprot:3544040-Prorocentrum_lima.AAC.1
MACCHMSTFGQKFSVSKPKKCSSSTTFSGRCLWLRWRGGGPAISRVTPSVDAFGSCGGRSQTKPPPPILP